MSLAQHLIDDMNVAMKAKNNATLSTLRLLRSAVKNKQIDVQHELSDEEIVLIVKTQVKQLHDSIESFVAAGREELIQNARAELVVLEAYLPTQLSDEALEVVVQQVIDQLGATSKQDMGKVMGAAVKAVNGQANGSRIKEVVGRLLPIVLFVIAGSVVAQSVYAASSILPAQFSDYPFIETGLRVLRVSFLWFGLFAVNQILHGGFSFMTASMRDNSQQAAMGEITSGVVLSVAVVLLYSVTTIVIQVM